MSNIVHLAQLEGDARDVATEMVRRWPDVEINDSRRSPEEQAERMARNCVQQPFFVLGSKDGSVKGTYAWSKASQLCHDWSTRNVGASYEALRRAFTQLLTSLPAAELRKLSRHIAPITSGAHAFDVRPGGPHDAEVCAYLEAEAKARGGRFLTIEAGLVRRHWQAKD